MSARPARGIAFAIGVLVVAWPRGSEAQTPPAVPNAPTASAQEEHAAHQGAQPEPPAPGSVTELEQDEPVPGGGAPQALYPGIPPITDADRAAAFPDVQHRMVHGVAVNYFVLLDQLEWQAADGGGGATWDSKGWVGYDLGRLWFRSEGEAAKGRLEHAEAHVLYGRPISRWWDVVVGVRQDVRPGPAQTWAAVGVQGLAPYWFEVETTAYVGPSGRTLVRLEGEYELLFTNRWILQSLGEIQLSGKSDPERAVGAGLSTTEVGLRLRYELRREFAPYIGLSWTRAFGRTGDFARAAGREVGEARLAGGLRLWF
jgi:copper resistance protein B